MTVSSVAHTTKFALFPKYVIIIFAGTDSYFNNYVIIKLNISLAMICYGCHV